jgi:predicted dehydrogenase
MPRHIGQTFTMAVSRVLKAEITYNPMKMIQVGTGSWGEHWCRDFLPPNIKEGLVEVVAAVDLNPQALERARSFLGLRQDQCYTDPQKAFADCRADFCTVVVPPEFSRERC